MSVIRTTWNSRPAWSLNTEQSTTLLGLGADDTLYQAYWGARADGASFTEFLLEIPRNRPSEATFLDGQPLAYPVYGMPTFKEVCLLVASENGARGTRLEFVQDTVTDERLDLEFRDPLTGLQVVLHFQLHSALDVIGRSATLTNRGNAPLFVERALSAACALPPDEYDLLTLTGQWAGEFQLLQRPLLQGRFTLGSTRGLSSHEAHPWFAVRPHGEIAEHSGSVWFGALAWSGNWLAVFDAERNDALNIVMGMQPFDSVWRLEAGESLSAPELVCGYSEQGPGGASRLLARYETEVQLPPNHRAALRPVLYNSWEATHFDVRADEQIELARRAADMGVELFVIDDGWFGARNHDRAGLGDWSINPAKFPNGVTAVIDEVHRLGMRFGIWVEPEMVNPDSDLYRAHPDWAYHVVGREPTLGRNQMVLNFGRSDVRDAIHAQLRRLLSEHGRVDFIKWDHNRAWTEVGWPENPALQREAWIRHVQGLYEVLEKLRTEFPDLLIESCAGGGGRGDLGILRWTDQVWTSDNTDAADRLAIQYGFSHAHSARVMVNWVTDVPNEQTGRIAPLEFRFHVAMQGVLGIGGNIAHWSAEEQAEARTLIAAYKEIRAIVQAGRQYWLRPPSAIGPCAVQYVSPDQAATVLLQYQLRGLRGQGTRRVRLHGLDPAWTYRRERDGIESSGSVLMAAGVPVDLVNPGDRSPHLDGRSRLDVWHAV